MNVTKQQSSASVTEQQLSSFLGKDIGLSGTPNLKTAFAKLANLSPGQQRRLAEVNNCRIPTVECDLENHRIIIHNWPGKDRESLAESPIHEIVDQIKDLYAYGDKSGRAGIAAKHRLQESLQNNSWRLCVTYYEQVKAGESNIPTPPQGDVTPEQLAADHLDIEKFDINKDGHTAIITCVASHFSKGDCRPQLFTTLQISDEELKTLRLTLANTGVTIEVVKEGRGKKNPRHTIRIVNPLDEREANQLLSKFVTQCCDEIRDYIEETYRTAAAEHLLPDLRTACQA